MLNLFLGISFESSEQKRKFVIWETQIAVECVEEEKEKKYNQEYKFMKNYEK